jgi:hypothetical protein
MSNVASPGRFLRHISSKRIYGYTPQLASNIAVEEVTEEEAYPERFMTKSQKKRTNKDPKVKLDTAEDVVAAAEPPSALGNPDVAADASRRI